MRKMILICCLAILSLSVEGCGAVPQISDEGYRKVSMTLDVAVGSDGSISAGACFGQGTIATILYFPFQGGEVVAQTSTLTVNSVPCLDCQSEIVSPTTTFPIELSAILEPASSAVSIGDEVTPSFMKDELRFWIATPPRQSLDIYYECGGSPATLSDYGSAVSNIASPFILEEWTQDFVLDEIKTSTRRDFIFPPTYKADITISAIETLVDEIQ